MGKHITFIFCKNSRKKFSWLNLFGLDDARMALQPLGVNRLSYFMGMKDNRTFQWVFSIRDKLVYHWLYGVDKSNHIYINSGM